MSEQVRWMKKNKGMLILAPFVLKALCEVLNICVPGQENSWLVGRGGLYGGMGPGEVGSSEEHALAGSSDEHALKSLKDMLIAQRAKARAAYAKEANATGSNELCRRIRPAGYAHKAGGLIQTSPTGSESGAMIGYQGLGIGYPHQSPTTHQLPTTHHQHKAIADYVKGKIRAIITKIKAYPKVSGVSAAALFFAFSATVISRFSKQAGTTPAPNPERVTKKILNAANSTPLKSTDPSPSSSKGLFDAVTAVMQEHGLSYIAAAVATVTAISGLAYIFYRKYTRLGSPRKQKQQKRDARGRWTGSPKKDLRSISDTELSDTELAFKYYLVDARGHIDKQALRKLKQQIARRAPKKKGGQLIYTPVRAQRGGNSNPIRTTAFTVSPKQIQKWKDCQELWKEGKRLTWVLKGCR